MKTIGIADFEKLVMERLANPRDYAGRSLVLWNADYNDYGIACRVIEQCCEIYNKENPNDQVWFRVSDMTFDNDDYTKQTCMCEKYVRDENSNEFHMHVEMKRMGVLFNTGCYMRFDQEDWFNFINTHTNSCGYVSQDCAVIVCAQANLFTFAEEQFGNNCDIYSIQPTLDEWAAWIAPYCHPEILKVVLAYIEKNSVGNDPQGFEYWQRIMKALDILVKVEGCPLNQIPKSFVEIKVQGLVGTKSPAQEFCDFIYEQDMSM